MRKIIVQTFLTLDGVMQAPGGPEEDPSNSFDFGGWMFSYGDETTNKVINDFIGSNNDLLLGRVTYDIFASYWPKAKGDIAEALNKAKKFVVSHDDMKLDWQNSELITGNVVEKLKTLKKSEGPDLYVPGSANLIQTLMKNQLVDEFFIWICPLVLGKGKRLFGEGTLPDGLELTWSKVSKSGVFMGRYKTGHKIKFGTIG